MSLLLGIAKIFLVIGVFRFANDCDSWQPPTFVYGGGSFALMLMDGDFGIADWIKLVVAIGLAAGIFYLMERIDGAAWLAVVAIGGFLLLGL